ncbi:cysteine synthase A [Oribacterium sp. C9]|uniref:cysteine synthase A n=1 Tax=Oribacterium sp. C9 TaxID=1943579 RepID=UPI0009900137|nr:cysteine synthase A [Oribacterium sp. C9]OON86570.1 cysteine synthase A [Oribacterium sp. C9]
MAKTYDSILELVGHTPIVQLHKLEEHEHTAAHIFAKLEFFNPTSSVKARPALNMVEEAERDGRLKPGGTIIEGTSGNTGIGLAAIAAAKGYKCIICMPDNLSKERLLTLKSYGAEVVLTDGALNMAGAGAKAAEILEKTPGGVIMGQGGNPANPGSHYKTTGPEIWEDLDGNVDIFLAASGTGGTISGAGEFLREKKPDVEIIAVEPKGSPVLNGGEPGPHKIQGIGGGLTPPVTKAELFNEVIDVTDEDAYAYARLIPKLEGFSVGISSGAALYAAVQVAKRPENAGKNIVTIIPDNGDRYLSGDLYL